MFEQVGQPAGEPLPPPLSEEDWLASRPDRDVPSWLDDPALSTEGDWLFGTLVERLTWVLDRRPCAATLQALEVIAQEPMTEAERVLFAQACDRQACAAQGLAVASLGEAAGPAPVGDEPDLIAVELGAALRVSHDSMRNRVHLARRLRDQLPAMLDRLCSGETTWAHARIVEELTVGLTEEQTRHVDAVAATRAHTRNASSFRAFVRALVARVDARGADERHRRARMDRRVVMEPAPDGMAWLHVLMTATDAIAAIGEINRGADEIRLDDDPRTHGERQAEFLLGRLFGTPAPADDAGRRPRRSAEVQVVIDLDTLLGLRDGSAELVGYGPVAASIVRELLRQDGTTIRRLVTDPLTGVLVDYGRTRYRPDALFTGLLEARDRTCRFPGCMRVALRCDKDHRCPWDGGGETSTLNMHSLCRRHHRLKTLHGYRYDYDRDSGATVWTTPLGFQYRNRPAAYSDPDPPPD